MNIPLRYLLSLVTLALLIGLSGCGKKERSAAEDNKSTPVVPQENNSSPVPTTSSKSDDNSFTLTDHNGITHTVTIGKERTDFPDIDTPVVILHFFTTWSQPCRGEAPYLSDLQVKYKKEIFVLGVLLHPDNYLQELDSFVEKNRLAYFISSGGRNDALAKMIAKRLSLPDMLPIPLTVIYHNGRYYKHYEGVVPVEMLEHDIRTLLK